MKNTEDIQVIGLFTATPLNTLKEYIGSYGINFPVIFDPGRTYFDLYEIGVSYFNMPPTYIIIDKEGIIRYRYDNTYEITDQLKANMQELLNQ